MEMRFRTGADLPASDVPVTGPSDLLCGGRGGGRVRDVLYITAGRSRTQTPPSRVIRTRLHYSTVRDGRCFFLWVTEHLGRVSFLYRGQMTTGCWILGINCSLLGFKSGSTTLGSTMARRRLGPNSIHTQQPGIKVGINQNPN